MPKPSSGRRGGKGKELNMSREDRWAIERYQEDIKNENQIIPEFLKNKEDMTRDEIRDAVITELGNGNVVRGLNSRHLDARYPDAKDSRFQPIIDGLNATRTGGRDDEDFFMSRVREITSNYTSRELGKFVRNELGEQNPLYPGRYGHETAIMLNLLHRFNPRGIKGIAFRESLGVPDWPAIDDVVGDIKQALNRRSIYRERIANIQTKYKKRSKK